MQKCLYLLCPTDYLESIINSNFRNENYFYTSLGNSVVFNNDTIQQIKTLIQKRDIQEISFVLSNTNDIIFDALGNQDFFKVRGLNVFYTEIVSQKEHSKLLWHMADIRFSILSYYLNKKIKELQLELNNLCIGPIRISGKVYSKQEHIFNTIYSNLICIEKHCLN